MVPESYWKELAATDDTLVFYMSSETLADVVENLVKNNIAEDKLLAVIEQATTPYQKVYTGSLYHFDKTLRDKKFFSPTLVIIGKVVALHQQFDWFHSEAQNKEYFKSSYESGMKSSKSLALTA